MKYTYKLIYDGADFIKWNKTFRRTLRTHLRKLGRKLATHGPVSLKHHITNAAKFSSRYPGNSLFYKASKNNRSVLYNVGFLRNAPKYELVGSASGNSYGGINVGFLNNPTHSDGTPLQTILKSIVKGGTWTPSPAQRRAYWAKVKKGLEKVGKDKVTPSKTYTQPPRDFMKGYLAEVDVYPIIHKHVSDAIDDAYKRSRIKRVS